MERELERYDERVVDESQDCPFREDMGDLAWPLGNMCLPNRLESVDSLGILLPHLHDLSKAAFSNNLEQLELVDDKGLISARLEVDFEMEGT